MKRLVTYTLFISMLCSVMAEPSSPPDGNLAMLKAQYEAVHKYTNKDGKATSETRNWILQMAPDKSYYYNPQTYFVDSLMNDPNGKAVYDAVWEDALHEFVNTGADAMKIVQEKGMMREGRYTCLKDFSSRDMTVLDNNGADMYRYSVPMDDLTWEMADSTKTVMGYECMMAKGDYHGRRWQAWFAPEIPVPDGPWQLCGLPGLIMEANTADGDYIFTATGLQQCDEPLKKPFEEDDIFNSNRKTFLKMKDYTRRNRSAQLAAMTNGAVKVNADYTGTDDFLETDYHE